nr:immunoglobulin light chain junction region [Macaca mulatta]MOY05396.1 immunoglobulin light chain junction region [Macaca mulatta]MOY17457.1 immunoglobulin light chain junction region [Macaca mulatta]
DYYYSSYAGSNTWVF